MLPHRYKRLINEIEELKWEIENKKLDSVQILQLQEFNHVIFLCSGGLDSPYEGYWFRVKFIWPQDYPFRPPKCIFLDKIWNPYVDFEKGRICMDILDEYSSPALKTIHIVLSLISLLSQSKIDKYNDGFLNPAAGIEMLKNYPYFNQHARELCQKHSYKKKEIYTDNMRGISQQHIIQVQNHQIPQLISENLASKKFKKKHPAYHYNLQKNAQNLDIHEMQIEEIPFQESINSDFLNNTDNLDLSNSNENHSNLNNQNNIQKNSSSFSNPNLSNHAIGQRQIIGYKVKNFSKTQKMTQDQLQEQIEKHRKKVRENLKKYGSKNAPS